MITRLGSCKDPTLGSSNPSPFVVVELVIFYCLLFIRFSLLMSGTESLDDFTNGNFDMTRRTFSGEFAIAFAKTELDAASL